MALLAAALGWPVAARSQLVPPEGGIPSIAADGYPRQPTLDVLHYGVQLEIPDRGSVVRGRTAILYQAVVDDLTTIRLDLGRAMAVDSVTVDGAPAVFERETDGLLVRDPGTAAGTRSEVVVWYHGAPADGLIIGESRHGRRSIFADNWADRAHHWFPAVDHPSDKARVEIDVVAPAGLEVVANGVLAERSDLGDGRARTRWVESAEIPVYGIVLGAADFAIERAGDVDGVEVSHWTFPEDSAAGAVAFARSTEILAFYDSLFGPYPYEKLAHVQSATKFGGMENPGAIFYDQETIGNGAGADAAGRDGLASLVAHETVHQWFGDAVTEADWNHLWLSEGFAEYFAAVFFEFHGSATGRGLGELARRMRDKAASVAALAAAGSPAAIYAPGAGPGEYERLLNANNYQKGAWVLHMLRHRMGDEAFFAGIRDYYATLRGGTAWTADFVRVMEAAAGRDLDAFFAEWVGRPGLPTLAARVAGSGASRTLRIEQLQAGPPWPLEVEVELRGEGSPPRRLTVRMEDRVAEAPIGVREPVEVVLDPDGWLLFEPGDPTAAP